MIQGSGSMNQEIAVRLNADASGMEREATKIERAFVLAAKGATKALVIFTQVQDAMARMRIRMGQAAAGVAAFGFYNAAKFEEAFMDVRKTVDATDKQFKSLAGGIRQMSTEMTSSATQLSKLAAIAGQLGVSVSNIENFTKVAAQLGDATEMSAEGAITALATFMNVTNTAATSVENIASSLVHLGNVANATEAQILNFSQNIAGTASAMGFAATDILAVGTAFSEVGIEAEAGATAVQRVLIDMNMAVQNGGDQLLKYSSLLGMTTDQFKAMWVANPSKVLDQFVGSLKKAGANAPKLLKSLGVDDVRLIRAFTNLANSSADIGDRMQEAASAAEDNVALAEEAEKRYQSFYAVLQKIKNTFVELSQMMFGPFLKYATAGLDVFQKILGYLTAMPGPLREVMGWLLRIRVTAMMIRGARSAIGLRVPFGDLTLGAVGSRAGRGFLRGVIQQTRGKTMETEGRGGLYRGGYFAGRFAGAPLAWATGRANLWQQARDTQASGAFVGRGTAFLSSARGAWATGRQAMAEGKGAFSEAYAKSRERFIDPTMKAASEGNTLLSKVITKLVTIERAIREQTKALLAKGSAETTSDDLAGSSDLVKSHMDQMTDTAKKSSDAQVEAARDAAESTKESNDTTIAAMQRESKDRDRDRRAAQDEEKTSRKSKIAGTAASLGGGVGAALGTAMSMLPIAMILLPLIVGATSFFIDRKTKAMEAKVKAAGMSESVQTASKAAGVPFTPWSEKQLWQAARTRNAGDLGNIVGTQKWQEQWKNILEPVQALKGTGAKTAYFQEMVMQMTLQKGGDLNEEDLQELYKVIDYVFKGDREAAYTLKMNISSVGLDDALDIEGRVERIRSLLQPQKMTGFVAKRWEAAGEQLQPGAKAAADITAMQFQAGGTLGGIAGTAAAYESAAKSMHAMRADASDLSGSMEVYVRSLQAATENAQGSNTLLLDNGVFGDKSEQDFNTFIKNVYANVDKEGASTNRAIVDALNQAYGGQERVLELAEDQKITSEDLVRIAQEEEVALGKQSEEYLRQTTFAANLVDYNLKNLDIAQRSAIAYGAMVQGLVEGGDVMQNYQSLYTKWKQALNAGDTDAAEELKALLDQAGGMVSQKLMFELSIDFIGKTPAQIQQEIAMMIANINRMIATEAVTPELGQQMLAEVQNMYVQQQQAALSQAQSIAQALVSAQRQRAEIDRSAAKSRQKAGEDHAKQVKKMEEGLRESYEKIDKEEQKAIKKSKENLTSWGSAYERLALKPVSSLKSAVTTMGRQVEKFSEMQSNLAKLQSMGLSNPRLLQYLGFDNPENYAQVERFLNDAMANPDLIKQLNSEWQDKFDLTQAFTDTSGISDLIKEEMDETRQETQEQFDKSRKEMEENYNDSLKEMAESVAEQHRQVNLQLTQMAEDMNRTFDEQMQMILNNPLFKQVGIDIAYMLNQGMLLSNVLGGAYATPGTQITTGPNGQRNVTGSGTSVTEYNQAIPGAAAPGWWDAVWLSNVINSGNDTTLPEGYKPSAEVKKKAIALHNLGRKTDTKQDELAQAGYTNHDTTPNRATNLRKYGITNNEMNAAMAEGGVVSSPTKALIGEAGPEAVIPLNQKGAAFMQMAFGQNTSGQGQMGVGWTLKKEGDGQVAADMREELELVIPVIQKFSKEFQEEYAQDHEAFKKRNDENAEDLADHLKGVGKTTAKAFTDGVKAGLDSAWLDKWLADTVKKLDGLITQLEQIKTKHIDISQAYSWWAFLGFKSEAEAKKAGKGIKDASSQGWYNYGSTDLSGPGVTGPTSGIVGGGGVTITSNVPSSGDHHKRDDFSEPWGDPRGNEKAWAASHLTNINHPGGSLAVHKISARPFAGFLTDLYASGYKPKDMSAWNVRRIAGSKVWSEHAWANAIDIDPTVNAGDRAVKGATNRSQYGVFNPNVVGPLAAKWNLTWGGLWDYSDPMHFEYTKGARWKTRAAQGAIINGRVEGLIAGESGREMVLPLNGRGMSFLLDLANSVRTRREAQSQGGSVSTSHTNAFGPVTVVSNDPGEMARKLEAKAREKKLTRPAGVST